MADQRIGLAEFIASQIPPGWTHERIPPAVIGLHLADAILGNPDVALRALGADFGNDVQDGDTRYLTVHFQWENS